MRLTSRAQPLWAKPFELSERPGRGLASIVGMAVRLCRILEISSGYKCRSRSVAPDTLINIGIRHRYKSDEPVGWIVGGK